jgi:hypothetical protein
LRQHPLRDVADGAFQFGEAKRSVGKRNQRKHAPSVANAIQHIAHWTESSVSSAGFNWKKF